MKLFFTKAMIIGVLATMPLSSYAQWEVGALIGTSGYQGDLTPGPFDFRTIKFAGGAFVRYNTSKYFTVKGNFLYGGLAGDDAHSRKGKDKERNLSFYSPITDMAVTGEINLRKFEPGSRNHRFAPYIFGGLAVFKIDPQAYDKVTESWVRLQPLGTEGQETPRFNERKRYSLAQISIPMGAGIKYNVSPNWNIGLEFGWRKTFTDYIDDVSSTYVPYDYLSAFRDDLAARLSNRTGEVNPERIDYGPNDLRGNSTNKDWYMISGITISYVILPSSCYKF